jgi:hypothetical protein
MRREIVFEGAASRARFGTGTTGEVGVDLANVNVPVLARISNAPTSIRRPVRREVPPTRASVPPPCTKRCVRRFFVLSS